MTHSWRHDSPVGRIFENWGDKSEENRRNEQSHENTYSEKNPVCAIFMGILHNYKLC